jgi:hypothetical protein
MNVYYLCVLCGYDRHLPVCVELNHDNYRWNLKLIANANNKIKIYLSFLKDEWKIVCIYFNLPHSLLFIRLFILNYSLIFAN